MTTVSAWYFGSRVAAPDFSGPLIPWAWTRSCDDFGGKFLQEGQGLNAPEAIQHLFALSCVNPNNRAFNIADRSFHQSTCRLDGQSSKAGTQTSKPNGPCFKFVLASAPRHGTREAGSGWVK